MQYKDFFPSLIITAIQNQPI
uniref:Uncharacterized protein n=1 Tax=Lepeophtheirus salmonis TaxID=72036 RepID=A0A0K2TR60_LEPSM